MKKYLLILFTVLSSLMFSQGQQTLTMDGQLEVTNDAYNKLKMRIVNPTTGGFLGPSCNFGNNQYVAEVSYEIYKSGSLVATVYGDTPFGQFQQFTFTGSGDFTAQSTAYYTDPEICGQGSYYADFKVKAIYKWGTRYGLFGNTDWCFVSNTVIQEKILPQHQLNISNENGSICFGESISFQVGSSNNDTFGFYKDNLATLPLNSNGNTLTLGQSQYVVGLNEFYIKMNNCQSTIKKVNFTVKEKPSNLVINSYNDNFCQGSPILITPAATGSNLTYEWSTNTSFVAGTILDASMVDSQGRLNFSAPSVGNFTYYCRAKNSSNCYSNVQSVNFTVYSAITNLTITNNNNAFCNGQQITFTAGSNGATNYQWYKDNLGAVSIGSGTQVTLSTSNWTYGANTIYVRAINTACSTSLIPVNFTVNQTPTNLQVNGNSGNYCIGNQILISPTAIGGSGISYDWSIASNFATLLDPSLIDIQGRLSYTPSVAGNVTYYVRAKSSAGSCYSGVETVTFNVSNQVSNVNVSPSNPVVCNGSAVTFTAAATNATTYKWTKDSQGVNVIGTQSAITLSAGDYVLGGNTIYLTVTNAGGCNVTPMPVSFTVNESPSNLEITGAQSTYCTGNQILITPSATGTGLTYQWSANSNFTTLLDASFVDSQGRLNFQASNTGSATYFVRSFNGNCYSSTKTVTFTVNTGVSNLQVSNNNGVFCQGSPVSFTVGANNATTYTWFKFNNATGVLHTGATYTPQTTDYSLGTATTIYVQASNGNGCSTALMPVTYTVNPSPENLQITGNAGNYCIGNPILITPSATMQGSSSNISYEWSLTSNFASLLDASFVDNQGRLSYTPVSIASATYFVRGKSNNGCYSPSATVTFTVNTNIGTVNITNQNAVVCNGSAVTFTAGATGATSYSWYQDLAGTISLGNNQNLTLQSAQYSLGANKIYAQAKGAGGCNSGIVTVNFVVNQSPTNLVITGNSSSYCVGSQILVTPSATGSGLTYEWSSNINFTTLLGANSVDSSGNLSYIPSNTGNYTYYVRAFNGSCYSNIVTYTFNVVGGVGALQVSNNGGTFCQGQTFNFVAGSTGATSFTWYKFSNATGVLSTGANYTPQTTDYTLDVQQTVYVQASNGSGCQTALMPVTYTVFTKPYDLQTSGNQNSYCLGTPILIQPTASVGTGNLTFEWSSTSNFANLLGTSFVDTTGNLSYTPSSSGTFTYFVRGKGSAGCYSDTKTVTFTVSNQVSNVTVTPSNPTVCFGSAVSFSASATNATSYSWSTDSQGVNVIGSNPTITLQSTQYTLGVNTIYLKVGNAGGCNGGSTPVSFTVNEAPSNLETTGNAGTYCTGSQILISPSATGNNVVYEWSANSNFTTLLDANFVDTSGNLKIVASSIGSFTYFVRAKNLSGCTTTPKTVTFTVNQGVGTLQVSNNGGTFCQGQSFGFTAGATNATTYTWFKFSNGTGSLSTGSTFTPTATQYTLGSNTIYVQASSGNNCSTALLPVTFTVNAVPTNLEVTGNAGTYCIGNAVMISPTSTGGTSTTFEWSVTSNFSSILGSSFVDASGNLSYTPGSASAVTYYVRAKGIGGCYSDPKTVTFTVSNQVSNVNITPSNPIVCNGSAVTFTAAATNATTYKWTTDAQGVNVIGNNSTLTLQATGYILGTNTIYLTVGNAGGCNAVPTAVSFTVNEAPTNLQLAGQQSTYCSGSQILVTPSATGTGLTYQWSANTNFSNLLDASFVDAQGRLNFVASNVGSSTYHVRATNGSGCYSNVESFTFNVNQGVNNLQVTNNGNSYCQGQTISFIAGAQNATTYSWYKFSNATGLLSTGSTFTPTATQYTLGSNTVYVQASSGNNCSTALLPVTFTVNAVPTNLEVTGNASNYCIGNPVLIIPTVTGGSSIIYEWSATSNFANILGSSFIDATGNLNYTPAGSGIFTYYVRAKGLGGCYSDSKTVTFTVSNQVSNVTVTPSNPTVCNGSAVTFTAAATNATTYKWTKDSQGVNIIGSNSSITLSAGDYVLGNNTIYLTVTNAGGCNVTPMPVSFTVNESPSNLEITGAQSTYCTGNQILITSSATGAGLTYQWSTNSNFTTLLDASFVDAQGRLNYQASSTGSVTYFVRAVNSSGCATAPKTVTFTVNQGVGTLQVTNNGNSYCQGQTISFTVGAVNASTYSWYKFSNATGLLSTGSTFTPTATQYTLGSNTIYVQASSGNNCSTALLPVTFTVNAVPTNLEVTGNAGTYCIGNPILLVPTAIGGTGITYEWSSTANFANLLGASFVDASGNLSYTPGSASAVTYYVRAKGLGGCYSDPKTVTFTVSNQVSNVTVTPATPTVCFGSPVTFTASAANATTYKWTSDIQGVNVIGNSSSITLQQTSYILGLNKIYLTVTNAGGCNATPMPVSFTVNEAPTNLEVTGNAGTYCTGGQVLISPSATGTGLTFEWSTNTNFTNLLGAGMILPDGSLSFIPSTVGSVTYFVRAVNSNGCTTAPKTVTFAVNQGVGTLQVSNNGGTFCQAVPFSFTVGAVNATTYSWYKFSNATGLLSTGSTFTPTATQYTLGSNTIYVQASSGNNCSTALLPVTFTVNAVPTNLEVTGNAGTYCIGTPVLMEPTATGGTGNIYEWSVTSNFVNLLGSSFIDATGKLSYTPSSSGTFTYFVRAKGLGGCYSDPKTVTFTVSNQVSNVTITPSNPSLCFGSAVSFTASASNATSFTWSTDNQSANVIGNSASITLQSTQYNVGANTIYLKVANAGGCNVTPIPVSFTVNPTPTNLVVSGNTGTYCVGTPILITPTATGTGLIYEWSTSSTFTNLLGTTFVDSAGNLNFNASTVGSATYFVRAKGQGGCVSMTETVTFTVNPNIGTVNISNQNAIVCNGSSVSFTAGASAATSYSWYQDSAALVSIGNLQNISIAATNYTLGLNTIYVQAKGAGGCNSALVPVNFTVNSTPTNLVLAGNQSSYCSGSQILVTPSASGSGITYQWSSSANFTTLLGSAFVDVDGRLNYVPANLGTFTYFVRGTNGSGCYSNVESITFNITQGVSNLQISNNNGVFCEGQSITFTVGATGASTFNFYKFQNGTGLLHTGSTFSPLPVDYTIGLNTIYVQATSSNSSCSTALVPINFTVNESPTAIAYTGETNYCLGQQVYIEPSALGNNLSYQWSTTANFASGNILGSAFVDAQGNLSYVPTTTGTKIYYVRSFNGSCYSGGIPVTIIVNTQPTNLAVNKLTNIGQTTYCQNGTIEKYLATGVNVSTYKWYTDVNLTQEVLASYVSGTNNNTLNVDPSIWTVGTHNLYIVGENTNGCKTQTQSINFSIIAGVSTISPSINNFSMCQSETRVVNLDNPNNFTINWYTNSAGTIALSNSFISNNGNTLTLPASAFTTGQTTLYYKVQNAGGCMSVLMPVSFTVLASPANLTVTNNNASACMGQNLAFEASAQNASEFLWYKNYATGLVAEPQYLSGTNNYKLTIPSGNFTAGTYTYTVVAKNSSGCLTAPIDVTFTVQSVPGNSTLTGATDYCKSEFVHYELVNSSSVSFKWYNDVNALNPVNLSYISNNGATLNIPASTLATGTHTLYYYATNGNCNSATQSVTFTVKETPSNLNTSGNSGTYCSGSLIDIVVGSQGGATNYEWFEDSSASLQLNPVFITGNNHERLQSSNYPVGAHTVYVRGVNSNGCKSALLPISFTVNAAPVVNSFSLTNATIQTGTAINFGVVGTGYTRWKLLFNGSQVAPTGTGWNNGTITNYTYSSSATLANAGNYTLVISNGTCEATRDFTVYVIPQITITHDKLNNIGVDAGVSKVILNQHDQITFSSSLGNTAAYTEDWDYGDGFNNTTVTGSHFYNNSGEFTVKLKIVNTINGDVFNTSYNLPILVKPENTVVPVDTLNPPDTNYTIYPNPYKEFLGLKFTGQAGDKFVIRVYSITGISVFNADWIADGVNWDKKWYNPLLNAPQGTYIVTVKNVSKNTTWSAKLLRQ